MNEADPELEQREADREDLTREGAREMVDTRGLESLAQLADKLNPHPIRPIAAEAIAEAVDELAGGSTATYINTSSSGINRVGVITDGFTVRVLMLSASWKWRGPYTPDDPEGYLNDRGYVPAPEVTDEH